MTSPKLSHTVTLTIPLAIIQAGNAVTVETITLKRPKTRHVKTLAVIVGPELLKALLSGVDGAEGTPTEDDVDIRQLVADIAPVLFSDEKLDAFQALIADLAGISTVEVGEIDPVDFLGVLGGFASFFPALQSIASKSLPLT